MIAILASIFSALELLTWANTIGLLVQLWLLVKGAQFFGFWRNAKLYRKLDNAQTEDEWRSVAKELDDKEGFSTWRTDPTSRGYNFKEITARIRRLTVMKETNDLRGFLSMLQADFHRDSCGVANPPLYRYRTGTKDIIDTYIKLVVEMIKKLAEDDTIPSSEKRTALLQVMRSYGHSALMLNSSVAFGAFHLGVVKALYEAELLPNIIFGANTGAVVAAFMCTQCDVATLWNPDKVNFEAFTKRSSKGSLKRKINRLWKEGKVMDVSILSKFVADNLGDITFKEAYEKTGRILNIHVGKEVSPGKHSSWLLNYLTAPNVLVRTAAVSSCATKGFYSFEPLLAKTMNGDVLPFDLTALNFAPPDSFSSFHINHAMSRMREQFNINCFIVSDATLLHMPLIRLQGRKGLLAQSIHFVMEEVWRAAAAISRQPAFRCFLTGIFQLMNEPILGEVVVTPINRWSDIGKLVFSNPDRNLMHYCQLRGEMATWPKLAQVKVHVAAERALAAVMHRLSTKDTSTVRELSPSHPYEDFTNSRMF